MIYFGGVRKPGTSLFHSDSSKQIFVIRNYSRNEENNGNFSGGLKIEMSKINQYMKNVVFDLFIRENNGNIYYEKCNSHCGLK